MAATLTLARRLYRILLVDAQLRPTSLRLVFDALRANAIAGELLSTYLELVNIWRSCETALERLDFEAAVRHTRTVDALSSTIVHSAIRVRDLMHPVVCAHGRPGLAGLLAYLDPDESSYAHALVLGGALVTLCVVGVRKRRQPRGAQYLKPKLN